MPVSVPVITGGMRRRPRLSGPHFSLLVQRKVAAGAVEKKHVSFGAAKRKYRSFLRRFRPGPVIFCRVRCPLCVNRYCSAASRGWAVIAIKTGRPVLLSPRVTRSPGSNPGGEIQIRGPQPPILVVLRGCPEGGNRNPPSGVSFGPGAARFLHTEKMGAQSPGDGRNLRCSAHPRTGVPAFSAPKAAQLFSSCLRPRRGPAR